MRLVLVFASFLAACGASAAPWWQGVPIRLTVDVPQTIDASTVRAAVSDRLWQLGFILDEVGERALSVAYDPACVCPACKLPVGGSRDNILGYTEEHAFDQIKLCPGLLAVQKTDRLATYVTVSHEMCHALGLEGHIQAGPNVLCSADYQTHKQVVGFGREDLRAICQAQGVKSSRCHEVAD